MQRVKIRVKSSEIRGSRVNYWNIRKDGVDGRVRERVSLTCSCTMYDLTRRSRDGYE